MSKPHKHSDLIKLWADGAEIQVKAHKLAWEDRENPLWDMDREYRIKPEKKQPVVRWLWAYKTTTGWVATSSFYTEGEAEYTKWERVKLEYTRQEFPE
jgi:hypothetical protein